MVQWMEYYLILLLSVTVIFDDWEEVSEFHLQRNLRASFVVKGKFVAKFINEADPWIDEILIIIPHKTFKLSLNRDRTEKQCRLQYFFLGALEVYDNYAIVATWWWLTRDVRVPQSGRQSRRSRHYIHDDAFIDTQIDETLIIIPCKIHEQWH